MFQLLFFSIIALVLGGRLGNRGPVSESHVNRMAMRSLISTNTTTQPCDLKIINLDRIEFYTGGSSLEVAVDLKEYIVYPNATSDQIKLSVTNQGKTPNWVGVQSEYMRILFQVNQKLTSHYTFLLTVQKGICSDSVTLDLYINSTQIEPHSIKPDRYFVLSLHEYIGHITDQYIRYIPKVTEYKKSNLSSWLTYYETDETLRGTPEKSDGGNYKIEVTSITSLDSIYQKTFFDVTVLGKRKKGNTQENSRKNRYLLFLLPSITVVCIGGSIFLIVQYRKRSSQGSTTNIAGGKKKPYAEIRTDE